MDHEIAAAINDLGKTVGGLGCIAVVLLAFLCLSVGDIADTLRRGRK